MSSEKIDKLLAENKELRRLLHNTNVVLAWHGSKALVEVDVSDMTVCKTCGCIHLEDDDDDEVSDH